MKKIYVLLSLVFVVSLISCGSQPKAEEPKPEAPVVNDSEPVVEVDEVVEVDDDVELINEEVSMPEEDDDEYLRSTQALSAEELVTKDEFAEDKAEILRIIKELQKVMEKEDVEAWLKYVDKDSKTTMEQLYAIGETSCNGVHGRNRLASNSLLESLVFAKRAAADIEATKEFKKAEEFDNLVNMDGYEDLPSIMENYHAMVVGEIKKEAKIRAQKEEAV
jgi:succinate dehydrogenase/fumarate reductase flavoprotein subunit